LASIFKKRNIKVITGGIHASFLPDEASQYFDSVVIGECEDIWDQILTDFKNNKLKSIYNGEFVSFDKKVRARRDLYSNKYALKGLIQTAKGCPINCEFCSVTLFNGGKYRQRPVPDILDELEEIQTNQIFFIDDNIIGYGKEAEERGISFFKGIVERGIKIKWFAQTSVNFALNKKLLSYAQKSGCAGLLVGFESVNEESLKIMNKKSNLNVGINHYKALIKNFHDYGIVILGAFIFGNDGDKADIFKRTSDFIKESQMDAVQFALLTPYPETRLFKRLQKENRLLFTHFPDDWKYYDGRHVVFKPLHMSPVELYTGLLGAYKANTTIAPALKKLFTSISNVKGLLGPVTTFFCNRGLNKMFLDRNLNCTDFHEQLTEKIKKQ
jgi:radical SAM superfamily enzyme YgiQ (UPF0313 family)